MEQLRPRWASAEWLYLHAAYEWAHSETGKEWSLWQLQDWGRTAGRV